MIALLSSISQFRVLAGQSQRFFLSGLLMLSLSLNVLSQESEIAAGSLRLQKPGNWFESELPEAKGSLVAVFGVETQGAKPGTFTVSVEPKGGRNLAGMKMATVNYIVTRMDGFVESSTESTLDGRPCWTLVYEGSPVVQSKVGEDGRRKFVRTIVDQGESFYVLHGVAEQKIFSSFAGTVGQVTKTARWIK